MYRWAIVMAVGLGGALASSAEPRAVTNQTVAQNVKPGVVEKAQPPVLSDEELLSCCRLLLRMRRDDATGFASLDRDHDDRLSAGELKSFLGRRGTALLARADLDQDGFLTLIEMRAPCEAAAAETQAAAETAQQLAQMAIAEVPVAAAAAPPVPRSRGPSAWIFFGRQRAYIKDYDVVNGMYKPVIGTITTGTLLEIYNPVVTGL